MFGSEWPPAVSWDLDSITSGMPNYFPTRVRRIFYVTSTLLPCFQNSAPAHVFVRLTHFGGKHQAVDCISLLRRTSECKQTEQWGLASHRAKPGPGPLSGSGFLRKLRVFMFQRLRSVTSGVIFQGEASRAFCCFCSSSLRVENVSRKTRSKITTTSF